MLILLTLFLASCSSKEKDEREVSKSANSEMEVYEISFKTSHPNAQKLMTDEFYWNPIEETSPFGNDDGHDAFYGFKEWRESNKTESPIIYLKELIKQWNYPTFDFYEMNEANLKKYISSNSIGEMMLTGQDNAIIAVGFGQFVLEGKIDEDLKTLTKTAIKRELLPSIIEMWELDYQKQRVKLLTRMLVTVDKMNENSN
jgi:uncharacterized protein YfeS